MTTELSTATQPPTPKPKRRPRSKQRGRKQRLGDGRTAPTHGTPESLANHCRRITKNGQTVAEMMLSIVKGIPFPMVRLVPNEDPSQPSHRYHYTETPLLRDRMDAGKWLVERGYGKAVEIVDVTGKPAFNLIFLGQKRDPCMTGELDRPKPAPRALDA